MRTHEASHFLKSFKESISRAKESGRLKPNILNITHVDLDGLGCSLTIKKCLSDVSYIDVVKANYYDIDKVITNLDIKKYDMVIITDISPSNKFVVQHSILSTGIPFILLDHHASAQEIHDPEIGLFIRTKNSATKYVYDVFTEIFNYEELLTFEYQELIKIIDDYDTWVLSDIRSKPLNDIFFSIGWDSFEERYYNGFDRFNKIERQILVAKAEELEKEYERLLDHETLLRIPQLKLIFVEGNKFTNDICHMFMDREPNCGIVVFRNNSSGSVSIRHKLNFHIGNILKELGFGGGHGKAGGMLYNDTEQLMERLQILGDYLIENNLIDEE